MKHTYIADQNCLYRDGITFASLQQYGYTSDEKANEVIAFASAIPAIIDSLRESLDAMERMDARLLAYSNGAAEGEKGEITRALYALALLEGKA